MLGLAEEIRLVGRQQVDGGLLLQRRTTAGEQAKVIAVGLDSAGVQPLGQAAAHQRLFGLAEGDSGRLEYEALKLAELGIRNPHAAWPSACTLSCWISVSARTS